MKPEPPGILDHQEREHWRDFLSWSQSVVSNVNRDLAEHSGLSIADLEVLGRLHDSDGGLEQQALGEWLRWSPSRLSHQLSRMAKRGLLHRDPTGAGRRMTISITDEGDELAMAAFAKMALSIRRHFFEPLSQEQLATLHGITSSSTASRGTGTDRRDGGPDTGEQG